MKNELNQYPVLRDFLGLDYNNPDDAPIAIYIQLLKNSHIELGLCLSDGCMTEDGPDIVKDAMNCMAVIYDSLKSIVKEQDSMR